MVSRNTTLVLYLGLRIGPACEAGLSAGMRRECVSPQIRKKERKEGRKEGMNEKKQASNKQIKKCQAGPARCRPGTNTEHWTSSFMLLVGRLVGILSIFPICWPTPIMKRFTSSDDSAISHCLRCSMNTLNISNSTIDRLNISALKPYPHFMLYDTKSECEET